MDINLYVLQNDISIRNIKMITPVRCFSCGTVVADKSEEFEKRISEGESPKEVLDDLGLFKICCRRMLISQVNLIDVILPYSN